jgi:hypothetical protein
VSCCPVYCAYLLPCPCDVIACLRYERVITLEAKAAKEAALLAAAEAKKLGPQPLEVGLGQRAYAVAAAAVLAVAWGHASDEALVRQLLDPQVNLFRSPSSIFCFLS